MYPIQSATNRVFTGTGANFGRPDVVPGCNPTGPGFEQLHGLWFNPACFTPQPMGTHGNAGRDNIIGPNLWNLDDSLSKDWRPKEQASLQFRAEAFNALNHSNYGTPNRFVNTPQFGTTTDATGPGREMQLSARLSF